MEDSFLNSQPPRDETGLLPGTDEYRRARKRRQNRESNARAQARKETELSQTLNELEAFQQHQQVLISENATLKSENEALKAQLDQLQLRIGKAVSSFEPTN